MPTAQSPAGLMLTATDNGNGTATLEASGTGDNAVTVSRSRVGGTTPAWTSIASIAGDGASTVEFDDEGYFLALSRDDNSDQTPPLYFTSSTGTDFPVWWRAMRDIQLAIVALGLDGMNPSRVDIYKVPLHKFITRAMQGKLARNDYSAGIMITPTTERIQRRQSGRNHQVDYGCRVVMYEGNGGKPDSHLARQLKWRERIRKRFDESDSAVTDAFKTTVEPADLFPLGAFGKQLDLQSLVIRVQSCERGD